MLSHFKHRPVHSCCHTHSAVPAVHSGTCSSVLVNIKLQLLQFCTFERVLEKFKVEFVEIVCMKKFLSHGESCFCSAHTRCIPQHAHTYLSQSRPVDIRRLIQSERHVKTWMSTLQPAAAFIQTLLRVLTFHSTAAACTSTANASGWSQADVFIPHPVKAVTQRTQVT